MKIVIAGSGKIGTELTSQLCDEGHDITLIDRNNEKLQTAVERYDVMSIEGNCATMSTLKAAGIEDSELLIATTGLDEVNLLACITAKQLNPNIHTIARIRNPEYREQTFVMRKEFALSLVVNPERHASMEIARLINFPGFLKQDTFVDGRVEIVEIYLKEDSALVNKPLSALPEIAKCQVLVCAVVRDGKSITPSGNFILKAGDEIFVTASTLNLKTLLKNLDIVTKKAKNVLIAGGSKISYYLAKDLIESGINVKIIEQNKARCEELVNALPKATITQGDVSSQDFMEEEGFDQFDALVTLTGLDELNIVLSLYGHNAGIPQVITKLSRGKKSFMLDQMPVGSIISPKELTANTIIRYVRAMENEISAAITVHKIANGQAEAIEFLVDENTKHLGEPLKDIKTKESILICCITRKSNVEIPNGESSYKIGDRVVIVSNGNDKIQKLNDIFEE